MQTDINIFKEAIKESLYEQFAKEHNIPLMENDVAPQPATEQAQDIAPGVAADTSLQDTPIVEEGHSDIVFEKGNLGLLQSSLKTLLKKPGTITRTLLPLIEKALIELLGTSSAYRRTSFMYNIAVSNNQIIYNINAQYEVDLFIGTDIARDAVEKDQNYIKNTIAVVPGLRLLNVKIDTSCGLVTIIAEI